MPGGDGGCSSDGPAPWLELIRPLYHIVRTSYLERVRRYGFLIVLGAAVAVGYSLVPASDDPYNAFVVFGHRGFYNSAWIGTVVGIVASTLLTLIGFFLVKDSVKHDSDTRVGEIIASTPVTGWMYILGKWLGNLAVLATILGVLTLIAPIMQFVRAEDLNLNVVALVAPIWLMGLPALALVSAVAVLFETLPLLRGSVGYLAYMLLFIWLIIGLFRAPETLEASNDFAGLSHVLVDLRSDLSAAGFSLTDGETDLYVPTGGREVARFHWDGIAWTVSAVVDRVIWVLAALAIALAACVPFARFDPARTLWLGNVFRRTSRKKSGKPHNALTTNKIGSIVAHAGRPESPSYFKSALSALEKHEVQGRFWATTLAEFRLLVYRRVWWWNAVALGLFIANLVSPMDICRGWLTPTAWLWPIHFWSSMGNLESRHRVDQIVRSVPALMHRQLPALFTAGVLVAVMVTGGYGIRLLVTGEWTHFGGWVVGVLFVPSLAVALGTWSRGNRLFEVVFATLWYFGSFRQVTILDYSALSQGSIKHGIPMLYLSLTLLLFLLAYLGRQRQLASEI